MKVDLYDDVGLQRLSKAEQKLILAEMPLASEDHLSPMKRLISNLCGFPLQ